MNLHHAGLLVATFCGLSILPAPAGAARASGDPFRAMRVERLRRAPVADHVLQATDGTSIRLADYRGKVIVVHFLLTN